MINLSAAYIDESGTHDDAAVICAGGYIFEANRAAALNDEMLPLFEKYKIPYFHAAEILAGKFKEGGKGKFDHLKADDRDFLARSFIESIRKHSSYGFAATVREADYDRVTGKYADFPKAYGFMLMACLFLVRRWIERTKFPGDLFYFFEDGANAKGDAIRWLDDFVVGTKAMKDHYRYHGRAFVDKSHGPAINAADLLVYRWYSHHANKGKPGYKPRKDLLALVRPQDTVMDWADEHLEGLGEVVQQWADKWGIDGRGTYGWPKGERRIPRA